MARTPAMMAISQALANPKRDDPGRRWAEVLREIPLFAGVPRRHVAKIAALTREARYRPGTPIVRAGARGDDFFVILEGTASVVRQQGLPSIPLQPGSYFGEMALLDGEARSASVVAETDVLCLRLSRVPFLRMVRGEPEVAAALLRQLAGRIRELQSRSQLTA